MHFIPLSLFLSHTVANSSHTFLPSFQYFITQILVKMFSIFPTHTHKLTYTMCDVFQRLIGFLLLLSISNNTAPPPPTPQLQLQIKKFCFDPI